MSVKALALSFSLFISTRGTLAESVNASTAAIQRCCRSLNQQLPHQVLYPGTAYEEANIRWSNTAILHPACMVLPANATEVSKAVKILTAGVGGNDSACPFAIKSGGHTPTPGANDIDNGITLDLRYINETTLSADHKSVTLGTGSTWISAYTNLNGTGVAFPGGRYGLVGVGGLALGGGLSFVSPKVGWVADNIINFEVVLSSGAIVNANSTNNDDLFHALKGGSGNFGIVTKVEMETFESDGKFWGGSVAYPCNDNTTGQVLSALNNFTTNNHLDQDAAFNSNFIYNTTSGKKEIANTLVYAKDVANRPIFQQAQSIQPQLENTAESTTIVALAANTGSLPYGFRYLGATVTFKNTLEAIAVAQSITDGIYDTISNVPDMQFTFVYEPIPRLYAEHSIARGGNVMGMNNTMDDLILLLLIPRWTDPEYDSVMAAASVSWVHAMEEANTLLGTHNDFTYLNYAAPFQDPLESYGAANLALMKSVAAKYDPEGVFQKLVPGGFKVSKARP